MEPLWADLINSDWHDYRGSGAHEDRIWSDDWLGRFLPRAGWRSEQLPKRVERESLRRLRVLLRRIVDQVRLGREAAPADLEALNQALEAAPVVRRLEGAESRFELVLEPRAAGIARVTGEVAADFAAMLARGEPDRIKICANPDCGWVMYDSSRNRSRRWCDKTDCGNLVKVRRHRESRRHAISRT